MQQITEIDLSESARINTLTYSKETFDRAFASDKDGFKPIHRRILYSMWKHGVIDLTKVSKTCGEVLEFHPHGDSSVYSALVRMAQPWEMNYPLVDIQGNKGGQDGTVAAAGRYIECKLSQFARDVILNELDDVVVDYEDNYDYKSLVPKYLPTKIPLLLVNGVQGIGVGFKTDVPPHNLIDVANRCIQFIKNKNVTNEELVKDFFPDFPTGGEILNGSELADCYKRGGMALDSNGKSVTINVRGKATLDTNTNTIILTEFPYGVEIDNITDTIDQAIKGGNMILSGITSYQDNNHHDDNEDETKKKKKNAEKITHEYACKKEANMIEILNEMGKVSQFKTSIQLSFMVNKDGYPKYVDVKDIISDWYKVRVDCIRRRHQRNISISQEKLHLYEGILSIYPRKKEVVNFISSSKSTNKEEIIEELHKNFNITKTQARGIYEMPLGTLSGFGEADLKSRIEKLHSNMLEDDYILMHIDDTIISELNDLINKYGRPRKTDIIMDYKDVVSERPEISKGVFLYSHLSLGLFDHNGSRNSKGLLNGLRPYKRNGKGIREVCGGTELNGSPKGFVVCYSDATIQTVDANVFKVSNVWYDTKCDEKDSAKYITAACPYYSDEDELVCLSDDFKIKRVLIKDVSKRASASGGNIVNIVRSDPSSEKIDCLMIGNTSEKGPTYSVVPIDDIPLLGRSASGVKCAFDKSSNPDLKIYMDLIDIGDYDETDTSRFFIGTIDGDEQGYIHSYPISSLKITGRTNKPKLLALPKNQKATSLIIGKVNNKEDALCMIGKSSTTTLSVTNFKKPYSFKRVFLTVITGGIM